jgi:hypothetical protein
MLHIISNRPEPISSGDSQGKAALEIYLFICNYSIFMKSVETLAAPDPALCFKDAE